MWFLRRRELDTGLPCDARGTWGCTYDANLAAVFGIVVGVLAVSAALVAYLASGRLPRVSLAMAALTSLLWLAAAAVLIRGTLS